MPGDIVTLVLTCAGTIFGFWITLWLISLVVRDSSIGDPLYPVGMAITAIVFYFVCDGNPARQKLVLVLTLIWAARLAWHIGSRNWGREDPRYARLRAHAESLGKNYALYSLTHVFLSLGAASGVLIAFPLFLAQRTPGPPLGALALAGTTLFFIGLTIETIADIQLRRFLRDPAHRNQILQQGLWRYSRHPNYFGEFTVWCGFFLIALETPWGWLAIASPLTLAYILIGPLGIGLVERRMRKKRPVAFAEYERTTSAFVPWFPSRGNPSA
jgi:steroid 5-alpha reductase family enzyme